MSTDNTSPSLEELGWRSFFSEHFDSLEMPGTAPARVVSERRNSYQVYSQYGELSAEMSGKMRYQATAGGQYPAIGDWVVIRPQLSESTAVIQAILPRKSKISRTEAGPVGNEQVIAANVDVVFIVSGLDGGRNLSVGRIERYLNLTWNGGAVPVIILNKVDLCPDASACLEDVEAVALGVPIYPVSATERLGLDAMRRHLARGGTAAFLGSSGVGKSTLINALLGVDRQEVTGVRQRDRKGRHTTSRRDLFLLPGGGAVIDTPGMREIQMWADEDRPQQAFKDIETLAEECHFSDCQHRAEPGCAVKAAIRAGVLEARRLEDYWRLQKELAHLARRQDYRARLEEKAKWRKVSQWSRENRKGGD
jgi:ribosome biogenesis GTPase / thiamine phosphate phosphatase